MTRPLVLLAICLIAAPAAVASDQPRSAIPWLSESLSQDPWDDSLLPMFRDPNGEISGVSPFIDDRIITSSLDDPVREGIGLAAPEETGFPADLWGSTSALRVRSLITSRAASGVPAARDLFRLILIAETSAPMGAGASNAVLLARIDALMAAGYLGDASAILSRLDLSDPEIFVRAFDVALLTGGEEVICARLRASPALSPTLVARVFCLARGGDWDAAALTLQTGHDVGLISGAEEELLTAFLDPTLVEDTDLETPEGPITTLEYIIRDAVALPQPRTRTPIAFEYPNLADGQALRTRIEAMERLVAAGVLPGDDLFALLREGKPASSGGIWDHSKVVQDLDDAFAIGAPEGISDALARADETLGLAGLRLAFAHAFDNQLAALEPGAFDAATSRTIFELLSLADDINAARAWRDDSGDAASKFLAALVEDAPEFPDTGSLTPAKAAAAIGLTSAIPPDETAAEIAAMFDAGRFGEALLRTLGLLSAGSEADPQDLAAGLYLLRHAGLDAAARKIAVQTLFLLQEA